MAGRGLLPIPLKPHAAVHRGAKLGIDLRRNRENYRAQQPFVTPLPRRSEAADLAVPWKTEWRSLRFAGNAALRWSFGKNV